MARFGLTKQFAVLDGSSANSSTRTSNPVLVADASYIGAMYSATTIAASVVSIDASWSDGFFSALTTAAAGALGGDWQRYNSIATSPGFVSNLTLGPRWLRFIRAATDSQASVVVTLRDS
jgi:hypothetical protein